MQTAGFLCPNSIAPSSVTAHRATAPTPWNAAAIRRKNRSLQPQQQRQHRRRASAGGGAKHILGARRRDDFFDDYDDEDLFDDLDDRRPVSPPRKRPKVPLLPATLSKVRNVLVGDAGAGWFRIPRGVAATFVDERSK